MATYYNDNTVLWLDGKILKASETRTDLYGQSLHYGYAVFGRISEGMDVIDKIARVGTGRVKGYSDAPLEDVIILSARRSKPA